MGGRCWSFEWIEQDNRSGQQQKMLESRKKQLMRGRRACEVVQVNANHGATMRMKAQTHHNRSLPPAPIPMPTDITNPVSLPPNTGTNANPRIQLHAHLEIPLQNRLWNGKAPRSTRLPLEAHHGVMVAFLALLWLRRRVHGRTVDGFVQDGILGVVLFHGGEVIGAFKEVLALARGIFCADGLAVNALGGEALLIYNRLVLCMRCRK